MLLNGLGLVMIHRIDLGLKPQSDDGRSFDAVKAPPQVVWTALGVALFVAILLIIRDHRVLQRYAYTLALGGVSSCSLPAVLPARYSEINGARIWIRCPASPSSPGEFAKILLTIFGAAYLMQKRDVLALAGRRFLGIDFPRGRDFGPLLVVWLLCIGVLVRENDLGTSLLFFGLFVVLLYIATERASWVIVGVLSVRRRRLRGLPDLRVRADPGQRVAAPVRGRQPRPPAISCASPCSGSARAASSAPGWAAGIPNSSRRPPTTSSSPRSAKRSGCSA